MASSLLRLPRELRDEIIRLVAFSPAPRPPAPQSLREGEYAWERLAVSGLKDGIPQDDVSSVVCQRTKPWGAGNSALGLLLANKQLHEETTALLDADSAPPYELDIMDSNHMFSGPGMWISWLCVPAKRRHVRAVHARLRLFDGGAEGRAFPRIGHGPGMFQPFFMSSTYRLFFGSMLQHGPGATSVSRLDYDANFHVGRFILDFQRPTASLVAGPNAPINMAYCDASVIEPASDEFYRWMTTFLQGGQDHQDSRIMYQGIGEVEIRVDGVPRHVVSLTESFCRLPDPDSLWPLLVFAHRWEFEAWVHSTIETRKKLDMWDESVLQKLRDDGEPECGLLIPGLWWTLLEDDWRIFTRPGTVVHRRPE